MSLSRVASSGSSPSKPTPMIATSAGTGSSATAARARESPSGLSKVSDLLVGDYLEQWLSGVVSRERPKTYVGYRDVVRLHITPVIGKKRLTKLTTQDVRRLVAHTEQKCICYVQGLDARREPGERRCC